MARISPAVAYHRAKIAALTRAIRAGERPDDGELEQHRTALRDAKDAERIAARVDALVEDWPAIPEDQIERIATLFRSGGAAP